MEGIFKSILLISAAGSVSALVLLCVKPLTKRLFSPKWQYYIWLTVLIAMVLPVKVPMPAEPVRITPPENTQVQTERLAASEVSEPAQPAALAEPERSPAARTPDIPVNIVRLSGFLWLAAAVLLIMYRIIKYAVFLRTIKKHSIAEYTLKNIPERLAVRKTELLDAPLVAGLIKPVLYLPQTEINEEELKYILLHELTHYRRRDLLYKWFAMIVSSIHWFNPFVYIVSRQIDEECEISCDYEACKSLSEPQKNGYMAMILNLAQTSVRKKRPLTTQMASGKKVLIRRFKMMKTKKATGKFVSALSAVLAFAMLSTTVFAGGVLSGLNTGRVIIDGKEYPITPIFIENSCAVHTDSYYVPLRETFEALGYEVLYDADKEKYHIGEVPFPAFEQDDYKVFYDEEIDEWLSISYKDRNDLMRSMVTNEVDYYIYGQTSSLNAQMPIIEIIKDEKTEYCQIGSNMISCGYVFAAPVLIDGTAYIPVRAVAYIVGGDDNVKWDNEKHDTYYEGALNFDTENLIVNINTGI